MLSRVNVIVLSANTKKKNETRGTESFAGHSKAPVTDKWVPRIRIALTSSFSISVFSSPSKRRKGEPLPRVLSSSALDQEQNQAEFLGEICSVLLIGRDRRRRSVVRSVSEFESSVDRWGCSSWKCCRALGFSNASSARSIQPPRRRSSLRIFMGCTAELISSKECEFSSLHLISFRCDLISDVLVFVRSAPFLNFLSCSIYGIYFGAS